MTAVGDAMVNVLLSTYNGERYLNEQLASIFAQSHGALRLTARDDGSADGTLGLLRRAASERATMTVTAGENLGVVGSFFALLAASDPACAYYALADQDDVWHPDKLERAIAHLSREDGATPLLYCSRAEYVDAALSPLGLSPARRKIGLANALVENVAIGCTIVFNRRARDLLLEGLPEEALMHDWWCYMVVAALGRVVFDPEPSLLYRQHGANQIGGTTSRTGTMRRNLARLRRREGWSLGLRAQARALLAIHGERLSPEARREVERFVASGDTLASRLSFALSMASARELALDEALLRLLIVAGRY